MALKRKRSTSAISPFSTSTNESSRDGSISPCPDVSMGEDTLHWRSGGSWCRPSSSDLDVRTRKRFRDNRPNDATIHANTYQMLFAAARSPVVETDAPAPILPRTRPAPPQRQPSLHNYWNICNPPSQSSQQSMSDESKQHRCEDCERVLPQGIDTAMGGMDQDEPPTSDYECRNCKRTVCDTCAVIVTGIGRDCLQCRTSRGTWVGGLGWVR